MEIIIGGLLFVILVIILIGIILFNRLLGDKNQISFAQASIDAQLKKRYDLLPNLLRACEKYMNYEQELLKDLTETRTKAFQGGHVVPEEQNNLSYQLRALMAVAERYPDLKASETFVVLQHSLNEVEDQLAAARRAYNASVTAYNNACVMFPSCVIAYYLGYKPQSWLESTENERQMIKIS